MRPPVRRPSSRICLALVAALALAGCGRRGPLELPPGAPTQAATNSSGTAAQDEVIERSADEKQQVFKEAPAPRPINSSPPTKPTGFILDPLL